MKDNKSVRPAQQDRASSNREEAAVLNNFASSFAFKVCTLTFPVPMTSGRVGGGEGPWSSTTDEMLRQSR